MLRTFYGLFSELLKFCTRKHVLCQTYLDLFKILYSVHKTHYTSCGQIDNLTIVVHIVPFSCQEIITADSSQVSS